MNIAKITNSVYFKILRVVVAIFPLTWIVCTINFHHLILSIKATSWWTAPLLFAAILSSMFLQGIRWWMLIKPFDNDLSLKKTLYAHFAGLYYSIILPTSAAQDVVRAAILSKETLYSVSWASTWLSRIIGLLTLAIMSLFGLFYLDRTLLPTGFSQSIFSAIGIIVLLTGLSFSKKITTPIRNILVPFFPQRFVKVGENIRQAVYNYRNKLGTIFIVFFVTFFMQLLITIGGCLVIMGISGKFLLFECLVYLPMIEILCISIPLTPNGIGIREGLLALMFNHIGLTNEQLSIYIILGFFAISLKLLGGIPVILSSPTTRLKLTEILKYKLKKNIAHEN